MVKKHVTVPSSGQRGREVSILTAWCLHELPQTPAPPSATSTATTFIGALLQPKCWCWKRVVSIFFKILLSMNISKRSLKTQGKDIFCLVWSLGWSGLNSQSMGVFFQKYCEILPFWGISAFALLMPGKKAPCGHCWSPDLMSHSRPLQAQPQPKPSEPSQNS